MATAGLPDSGSAPAVASVADGLRTAMWVGGAASVMDGLLAFTLRKPSGAAAAPEADGTARMRRGETEARSSR
ncbi:hypothetical protein ABZY14_36595 [Streptomyces sp. NPDC006617]|uniref:hypothetical protein n=1 Tax=Streptomyces sp. NPDC006617 TaxID=3155354 RepID=UPI0033AA6123